ncbi:DUF4998 domain-containing protein [Snuella lapsa]|uniref:F5/8 type C domain-containing protein n=1 Tax=Snuella lapsa TaxID=870481 RepID=A0ABP6XD57_9FLAO
MKKIKHYIIPVVLLFLIGMTSCSDTFEHHEKYIKDGEIIYSTKVDSLHSLPGNGRIKLVGTLTKAFTVNEVTVYWDKGESFQTFSYSKSDNDTDVLELIITGLEERSYEFDVYSKDADGNQSIKKTVFGTVYGETFRSNLEARGINSNTYDGTDAEISFGVSGDEYQRSTEIKYVNKNDEEVIVMVGSDESAITLTDVSSETPVMYRTFYVPTLTDSDGNETSIDEFPSDWKSLELVLTGSINYGKSDWVITDFSSEEPAEANWSSYDYQGKAEAAIDGILETFWHSDWANQKPVYPHYFAFDMGVEKTIKGFEVFRRQGNGNGQTKHKFYVSLDGSNWTDLGEFVMDATTDAGQVYMVDPIEARYVKYEATEGSDYYAFLAEINVLEVFDSSGMVITDFSSEMGDAPASNTIDGQLGTFWHSEWSPNQPPYPHHFTFDMGVEKTVTSFEVFRRQGDGRGQTKHKFYVSLDGTNWTDLGEYDMDSTIDAGQLYDVAPTKARYIKYEATEGPNFYCFLAEINVIGY